MMQKYKPDAYVEYNSGEDGKDSFYEIVYDCPNCGKRIKGYARENACDRCGTFFAWGNHRPRIVVERRVEWD